MIRRSTRAMLATLALAAIAPMVQAQTVTPPATSPGGGPQRWNVVDGVQKMTVPGYLAKESLAPLPPVAPKSYAGAPRANTKRTRAVVEDAVFTPLNKRKATAKYRYQK